MTIEEILEQYGALSSLGFGDVLVYLIIAVISYTLICKYVSYRKKNAAEKIHRKGASTEKNEEIIAAITAAVNQYRSKESR